MKKLPQNLLTILLVILAFVSWKLYGSTTKAAGAQVWTPGCLASVPRSWGVYRGGSAQSGLAFEDSTGTLRFLTNLPCDGSTAVVALQIRRTGNLNGPNQ